MTVQLEFPAPSVPVETSEAAADSLGPKVLSGLRLAVLRAVMASGAIGLTTDELESWLDGRHQTISPRVNELAALGYLERTTEKRATRSGRMAFVYRLTQQGRKALAP